MTRQQTLAFMTTGLLAAAPAFSGSADDYMGPDAPLQGESEFDTAQVLSAEPMVRQVHVSVPQRECYTETRYVPVNAYRPVPAPAGQMLLGGLIGGVIGHQFDNHHSHNSGTVAGALIGTAIGHQTAQAGARRDAARGPEEFRAVDAERCDIRTIERVEERIDGYRVTYRYNGRVYSTQMPHNPGSSLRVRVNVAPVG